MKKEHSVIIVFLFVLPVLLLCSCSNMSSNKNTSKNKETIVGRWLVVSSTVKKQHFVNEEIEDTENYTDDVDYTTLEFTSDGSIMIDNKDEGVYTIDGNTITWHNISNKEKLDLTIEKITNSVLVLVWEHVFSFPISDEEEGKVVIFCRTEYKKLGS